MSDIFSCPIIGAQVFIESGQTLEEIDAWFRILKENRMPLCRIRMFEVYMHKADGTWDFSLFDWAFQAAEKYGISIFATLFPATSFNDIGGFKFPKSAAHLQSIGEYIGHVATHFKEFKALYGWVLLNEPGLGMPFRGGGLPIGSSDEGFTLQKFETWKKEQAFPGYHSKGYMTLDFSEERFILDYTVWFLRWIAEEIKKYDPGRHLHVNNHAIFQNVAEYDFPSWRPILNSLGGSAHASWHFGYFKRKQYAVAMAADCEIVRSGAGNLPWWITEIQGGNNTYSGFEAMCPTHEEISQWLWMIIGSGGKGGIFWCLNPRASGREAGEWAMLNFHDEPSDRMLASAQVAGALDENKGLFAEACVVESGIIILYVREALWIEKKLQTGTGGVQYEGRVVGGVMKSALAYFEVLCEMGIQCNFKAIDEFDFQQENYSGVTIILAHQISIPSRHWKNLEQFVNSGGKLIVEGLTAYYDENAHCIMKTGFPLIKVFGASINEFKLIGDTFDVMLSEPRLSLPGHCWQGTIRTITARAIGYSGDEIVAVRNAYGKGEVCWIPSLVGMGCRLKNYAPLAAFLKHEVRDNISQYPVRFEIYKPGIIMKTLCSGKAYISVIINKNMEEQELKFSLGKKILPSLLYSDKQKKLSGSGRDKIRINQEETLVIKWD